MRWVGCADSTLLAAKKGVGEGVGLWVGLGGFVGPVGWWEKYRVGNMDTVGYEVAEGLSVGMAWV